MIGLAGRTAPETLVRLGEVVECDPKVLAELPPRASDVIYREGLSHPWTNFLHPHPFLKDVG
jgi:hypothetical protein